MFKMPLFERIGYTLSILRISDKTLYNQRLLSKYLITHSFLPYSRPECQAILLNYPIGIKSGGRMRMETQHPLRVSELQRYEKNGVEIITAPFFFLQHTQRIIKISKIFLYVGKESYLCNRIRLKEIHVNYR